MGGSRTCHRHGCGAEHSDSDTVNHHRGLNREPYTLSHEPYTLNHEPYTLDERADPASYRAAGAAASSNRAL
jgi:hypothetical protein